MSSASALHARPADRSVKQSIEVEPYDCNDGYNAFPDNQLQRSLDSKCRDDEYYRNSTYTKYYPSRKYSWDEGRSSCESDFLSEVSGQFDDAEEFESPVQQHKGLKPPGFGEGSPSSYSIKRQRSNDWPKRSVENLSTHDGTGTPTRRNASRQRWPFSHQRRHASSSHGSPRIARPGRRSRFVEGHMADTISEKPPSIFFPDEKRANETAAAAAAAATRNANRNSGIFRFGKAIASAFNPFGGWGSVSEIWRGSQVQTPEQEQPAQQEAADDRLRQAQLAYEELKKAGFQGTNKGNYMQGLQNGGAGAGTSASIPESTWRAIQEKMEHGSAPSAGPPTGPAGGHSRQSSGQAPSNRDSMSGSSLRPSFADLKLRKARSSLTISRKQEVVENKGQEVRHQKSRKDIQREAKLLKRVSNLEDKLTRARRELREISSEHEEEPVPRRSLHEERTYQRKFVPGALPSLPSERLLYEREDEPGTTALLSPPANDTLQVPDSESESQGQICVSKTRHKSPKPWRRSFDGRSSSAQSHSPSRKRKSPDPESRKKSVSDQHERQPPPIPNVYVSQKAQKQPTPEPPQTEPTQEPKPEPAVSVVESEAGAEVRTSRTPPSRKPKLPKNSRGDSPGSVERKQRQKSNSSDQRTASPADERASRPLRSSTNRNRSVTPALRMKKGRGDLRSTASPGHDEDKENQHAGDLSGDKPGHDLQQAEVDSQKENAPPTSPSPSPAIPSRRKARYECIPPVPPLPKDLAATAAKVDRRLAREMGKRRAQTEKDGPSTEKFQWPEDIF